MSRSIVVLAGVALALGACGGDSKSEPKTPPSPKRTPAGSSAQPQSQRKPAAKADVAVIRGWTDALRHGQIKAASGYFGLPAIVSNGGPPVQLDKRADVRFFNRTLPCGAKFKSAIDTGHYVVATLVLTERPGAGQCGGGVGSEAYTAFLIERHKIVQWRRVVSPGPEPSSTPQPES